MTSVELLAAGGAINALTLDIAGNADFDSAIIALRVDGTLADNDAGTKLRLHTDGYRATLATTWAADHSATINTSWFNCITAATDPVGGYCVYATVFSPEAEEGLVLHWVSTDYINVVGETPANSSTFTASGSGLDQF
jgi:hypothetical protein